MLQWLPFCFYFFQVIGKNQVSVPTHLYKVIMVENDQTELLGLGAFIIPNQPIGFEHKLQEFQVDLILHYFSS
jgi:nuclease EXOG